MRTNLGQMPAAAVLLRPAAVRGTVNSQKKNLLKKLKENISLGFLVIKKHVLKITPLIFCKILRKGGGGYL